jgi:hypothetical protein
MRVAFALARQELVEQPSVVGEQLVQANRLGWWRVGRQL